jgi:hypothetical protein
LYIIKARPILFSGRAPHTDKPATVTQKYNYRDVALCRSWVNRRLGGTYRLHLQGRKISELGTSVSRWLTFFIVASVKTLNLTEIYLVLSPIWVHDTKIDWPTDYRRNTTLTSTILFCMTYICPPW